MNKHWIRQCFQKAPFICSLLNKADTFSIKSIKSLHSKTICNHTNKPMERLQHNILLQNRHWVTSSMYCTNSQGTLDPTSTNTLKSLENIEKETELIENPKILKVAIIGTPNAGKSTLINALCGVQVCPTSSRVHTTTFNARAMMNIQNVQIIFVDTPGAVFSKEAEKYHLNHSQMVDPPRAVSTADLIAVLHDVSLSKNFSEVLSRRVLRLLACNPLTPAILILNKIDRLKNKDVLVEFVTKLTSGKIDGQVIGGTTIPVNKTDADIRSSVLEAFLEDTKEVPTFEEKDDAVLDADAIFSGRIKLNDKEAASFARRLDAWPLFKAVYSISALKEWDLDRLREHFVKQAYPHPWIFPPNVVTDQLPSILAANIIRSRCLEYLPSFLCYFGDCVIDTWEANSEGVLVIKASLIYPTAKHAKRMMVPIFMRIVQKIIEEAEVQIEEMFHSKVKLSIETKCLNRPAGNK